MRARGLLLLLVAVCVGCDEAGNAVHETGEHGAIVVSDVQGEWEVLGVEPYEVALTSELGTEYLISKSDGFEDYTVVWVKPPTGTERSSIAIRLKANGKGFYSEIRHVAGDRVVPVFVYDGVPAYFKESEGEVFLTEKDKQKEVVGQFRVANFPTYGGEIFDDEVKESVVLAGGETLEVLGTTDLQLPSGMRELRLTGASDEFLYRIKPKNLLSSYAPFRPVGSYGTMTIDNGGSQPLTIAYGRHQAAEKVKIELQIDRQRRDDLVVLNIDGVKVLRGENGRFSGLDFSDASIKRDAKSTRALLPNGKLEFALPKGVVSTKNSQLTFSFVEPEIGDGLRGERFKGYGVHVPLGQPGNVQCSYGEGTVTISMVAIEEEIPDTLSLVISNSREAFDSETVELVVKSPGYDGAFWTTSYSNP